MVVNNYHHTAVVKFLKIGMPKIVKLYWNFDRNDCSYWFISIIMLQYNKNKWRKRLILHKFHLIWILSAWNSIGSNDLGQSYFSDIKEKICQTDSNQQLVYFLYLRYQTLVFQTWNIRQEFQKKYLFPKHFLLSDIPP